MTTFKPVAVCMTCQQEHGVNPHPDSSHGYCKRHLILSWTELFEATSNPKHLAKIQEIRQRPATEFPPDIGCLYFDQEREAA